MSRTMPLPVIVDYLVRITGCSDELAKAFIVEFSEIISNALDDNGQIEISGIGVFRKTVGAEGPAVEFVPDQALASAVNKPFAMFEPVELDDEITEEMLDAATYETGRDMESDDNAPDEKMSVETAGTLPDDIHNASITIKSEDDVTEEPSIENDCEDQGIGCISETDVYEEEMTGKIPPPIPDEFLSGRFVPVVTDEVSARQAGSDFHTPVSNDDATEYGNAHKHNRHHVMAMILVGVSSLLAGLVIGYFAYERLNLHGVKSVNISAEEVQVFHSGPEVHIADSLDELIEIAHPDTIWDYSQEEDNVSEVISMEKPVTAHEEIVTDTVRGGRFLTTIALEHYGRKKFWVYIYLENMDKLGDPDLIPDGTVVVVPPAEKYGIQAGDVASEALAEQKAAEIMDKYSKK